MPSHRSARDAEPKVVAHGIVRRFGARAVLDGLDLELARSEFVILLGQSGCGKSTLLRLLGGLDLPDEGTIRSHGKRAIVFQERRLLPWQRVWRNVTVGLHGSDDRRVAPEVLEEVGLRARPMRGRRRSREARPSASHSPGRWSRIPSWCCWTSRSRPSMRSRA